MESTQTGYEIALERIAECKKTQAEYLDLSNLKLETLPPELFELVQLQVLNLGSRYVFSAEKSAWIYATSDIGLPSTGDSHPNKNNLRTFPTAFSALSNLLYLNLDDNAFESLETLPSLPQLKELNASYNQLTSLGHFPILANLVFLNLEKNAIEVFEQVHLFPNLLVLNLYSNEIHKLGKISQKSRLQELNLSRNRIEKIENLNKFPDLLHLNLKCNPIKKLQNLNRLPKLKVLNLESCWYIEKIENLNYLSALENLNLGQCKIQRIQNLHRLKQLKKLNLTDNKIKKIENLNLPQLEKLYLGGNEIQKIENLNALPELQVLFLCYNEISKIEQLNLLPQLTKLDLRDNYRITKLENLDALPHLKDLYLEGNRIQKLENLHELTSLEGLRLERNQIDAIENLAGLPQLSFLDLGENKVEILDNLYDLPRLRYVNLNENAVREIGTKLDLPELTELCLYESQFQELKNLNGLPKLQQLQVDYSQVATISPELYLPTLERLELKGNEIRHWSATNQFPNLKVLDLSGNQLHSITPSFAFPKLEQLSLNNNALKDLQSFGFFPALKSLDLQYNQLQYFYESDLAKFPLLKKLILRDNPIENLPPELLTIERYPNYDYSCLVDVQQWFAELALSSATNTDFKVIICGNGGVGKSRILDRLLGRPAFVQAWNSTHGIRIERKVEPDPQHPEQQLSLNFWDFGGQTLYHAAHRLFMRSRAVYLVVWDTEHEPSSNLYSTDPWGNVYLNENLAYWVGSIQAQAKNSAIVIFQNKVDAPLDSPAEVSLELLPTEIRHNCQIEYGSAKNALRISDVQQKLLSAIQSLPEYGQMMPSSWKLVRGELLEELLDMQTCRKMIDRGTFDQLCHKHGVLEATIKADSLLLFLHRIGLIFYHSWYFEKWIILDQQWAIDAIYTILDRRSALFTKIKVQNGVFDPGDLFTAWTVQGYGEIEQQMFFEFMRSYGICLCVNEKKVDEYYLLPALLPETPALAWQEWTQQAMPIERAFIYQHPFYLHVHDMHGLLGDLLKQDALQIILLWQNGVILQGKNPDNQARISLDFIEKKILIETKGAKATELIQFIRYRFSQIYRSELPLHESASLDGQYFLDAAFIREAWDYNNVLKIKNLPGPDNSVLEAEQFQWARSRDGGFYRFED